MLERGPRETPLIADDFELLPGVTKALRLLKQTGWPLIVVTNQPNVAKGKSTVAEYLAIERRMHKLLGVKAGVDAVYACQHLKDNNCSCRKPKAGLLIKAAADYDLNLKTSVMIGDSDTDIEAGRAVGCQTIKVGTRSVPDLLSAVPLVLQLVHENIY